MTRAARCFLITAALLFARNGSAFTVTVDIIQHSICGRPTGVMGVVADGGIPPFTYLWSNGQQEQVIGGLVAGTYTVEVYDSMGEYAGVSGVVLDLAGYPAGFLNAYQVPMSYCAGELPRVAIWHGVTNGQNPPPEDIYGPMPYSYSHPDLVDVLSYTTACGQTNVDWYQVLVLDAVYGQSYYVDYQDGDGCPGQVEVFLKQPIEWPTIQVGNVTGTCATGAVGTVTVNIGAQPQFNQHPFMIYVRPVDDLTSCPSYGGLPSTVIQPPETEFPTTRTITGLGPGDHWLVWTTDPLSLQSNNDSPWEACKDSILISVPVVTADCGTVNGTFFVDVSGNCSPGSGEPRVPHSIIEISPGPLYVTSNTNGAYSIPLPFGDYTFTELHPLLDQSCDGAISVTSTGVQTRHIACAPLGLMDVEAAVGAACLRPGFQALISAYVENLTPDATGALTVTLTVDPLLSILSTEPQATTVAGNTITWELPDVFAAWGTSFVRAWVQVPPDPSLIGTSVTQSVVVSTGNTDADLSNNLASVTQAIQGSYDPNDKTAATSSGSSSIWSIGEDEWIDYLIRFQNTGTDTAFGVVITDTLPAALDPSSIQWGSASHPHVRYLQGAGILRFVFADILLPDSNVNEPASHGWISFRIRPHLPVASGTVIENVANIYFDYNPPVITEPSVLVAEFSTGVPAASEEGFQVFPNPAHDRVLLVLPRGADRSFALHTPDGRVVEVDARPLAQGLELDVAALPPGLYTVRTAHGSARFVKQ